MYSCWFAKSFKVAEKLEMDQNFNEILKSKRITNEM